MTLRDRLKGMVGKTVRIREVGAKNPVLARVGVIGEDYVTLEVPLFTGKKVSSIAVMYMALQHIASFQYREKDEKEWGNTHLSLVQG